MPVIIKAARIFCGHTHAALHKHEHGIDYFNCGSWIDAHPTYITVGEEGVQIHEYVERPDDLHPAQEQSEEQNPADAELPTSATRQDSSKMANSRVWLPDPDSSNQMVF